MLKRIISLGLGFFLIYPILILPSCATKHNQALRNELSGRGEMTLDLNNPYLAPNKFLSEEAKESETLKGFLSLKGAPELLEFSDPVIGTTSLTLIYKAKNESYTLEQRGKEWIITGPRKINPEDDVKSANILIDAESAPTLLPLEPASVDTVNNKSDDIQTKLPITETPAAKDSSNNPRESRPAFKDVYHEVNFNGQTISFLAHWYTGNILNGERIRRINSSLSEILKNGDLVRIPSYLALKDEVPTEADFQKFLLGK